MTSRGIFDPILNFGSYLSDLWPFSWFRSYDYQYQDTEVVSTQSTTSPGSLTDCHSDGSAGLLQFTAVRANGTLATVSDLPGLFYVQTPWYLTHPRSLLMALLNDDSQTQDCPKGHCYSYTIPGTELRLREALDPTALRLATGSADICGYRERRNVQKMGVLLGSLGDFTKGARMTEEISRFMQDRMKTTYPKLEIGLILGFTLVLPGRSQ